MAGTARLKLGILGLSEGNGHPYSWAAIFNGYDPAAMASCPFPAIPAYLTQQVFPDAAIPHARVTHVWAQERPIAEQVAAASLIPTVVQDYREMIGHVDAILLARDDTENHLEMSAPFLDAGLPVYIDKPVALSLDALDQLYEHQRYPGQIFSCSALRYADELRLTPSMLAELGEVRHIQAVVPKNWEKYGVHALEPVLSNFGLFEKQCEVQSTRAGDVQVVTVSWASLSASFTCLGTVPTDIRMRLFGRRGQRELVFTDTYAAFKRALEAFVDGVRGRREAIPRSQLSVVVHILERGIVYAR